MTHIEHRARWKQIADFIAADSNRTCCDAMKEFDLSAPTIRDACYLHNVQLPRKNAAHKTQPHVGKVTAKALTIVARLLDPSLTIGQIADEFEVTTQAVYDAARRATAAGIVLPSRSKLIKQEAQ